MAPMRALGLDAMTVHWETAVQPQLIASPRVLAHIGSYGANRDRLLCQNCVTCPPKPRSNTVVYGSTSTYMDVAGSR